MRSLARCCDTDGAGLPTRSAKSLTDNSLVDEGPQHPHASRVRLSKRQHLDHQTHLIVVQPLIAWLLIYVHTQILADGDEPPSPPHPAGVNANTGCSASSGNFFQ